MVRARKTIPLSIFPDFFTIINLIFKAAKTKKIEQQKIRHLPLKAAEDLHEILLEELEKAEVDFQFNYNLHARENFITKVVGLCDDFVGFGKKMKK